MGIYNKVMSIESKKGDNFMEKFVDRINELEFLNKEYNKKESSLVILYGRRRIGKTSLIKEFGKNKDMIYFLATEEAEIQNRNMFKNVVADNLKNALLSHIVVQNWDEIFRMIVQDNIDSKKVIVIDEFQYLGKVNSSFPSIFQRIWDEILMDKNVMVILCGSLINMMESQTLNYNSPLYGRRTGQIKLKQIPFENYKEFFDGKITEKQLIEKYAVTGGVPKYIEHFNNKNDIYDEIQQSIMNKQSYLYDEPTFLLQNEVSEVGSYFSIIKSIAAGNRKLGNISSNLSVSPTNLSKYLQTLINLDIIEREVPITEHNPEKSKKGQYKIKDNFIAFWFQFIYPNKAFLEMGEDAVVIDKIKKSFIDNHVAFIYEEICKEKMWNLNINGKLNMSFSKLGRWWNSKQEIDFLGIDVNSNDVIFGECKYYTNKLVDVDVFYELKEKAKSVQWKNDTRKERYILFSITGYTNRLKQLAEDKEELILG